MPRDLSVKPAPGDEEAWREHIVIAAETCFARWGVTRTRMEDIAREAAMPRPALYRWFDSKRDVQTAVMVRHIRRRAAELHAAVPRRGRAGPLILRALLAGTVEPPGDHVSESVLGLDTVHDTAQLVAESPAIFAAMREYWEPYLAYAARRGELRDGVVPDDAVRWLTMIVFYLLALPEVAPPRERLADYLQTYVVDALVIRRG